MTCLSPDAVLKRFELVSGYDRDTVSRYITVILDCVDAFSSRLPEREYDETQLRRLTHACAVYAYYRVSLCTDDGRVSSFKAGDVQYTASDTATSAELMWEREKEEIADLADFGSGFLFRQVRA